MTQQRHTDIANIISCVKTRHPFVIVHLTNIASALSARAEKVANEYYPAQDEFHDRCTGGFLNGFVEHWVLIYEKTLRNAVPVLLSAGWSAEKIQKSLVCDLSDIESLPPETDEQPVPDLSSKIQKASRFSREKLAQRSRDFQLEYAAGFGMGYSKHIAESNAKLAIAGKLLINGAGFDLAASALGVDCNVFACHLGMLALSDQIST
jgi:hypothetical protein